MKTSEAVDQIFDAMAKAQAMFEGAKKDSTNPHFKSKYASFSSVLDACRDGLTANKLTVLQDVTRSNGSVDISTRIGHSSGQWIEFGPLSLPLPPQKADAQAVGSCTTYGRRYALSAALGLASEEDDDANSVSQPRQTKSQTVADKIPPAAWHPVDGPPPPSDNDAPPQADDDSVRFYQADGSHVDVPTVGYGKNKGTPVSELSDKSLQWYIEAAKANIADPAKAKWKAKEQAWLDSVAAYQMSVSK